MEYSLTDKGLTLESILVHIAAFAKFECKAIFKAGRQRTTIKQIFRAERLSGVFDY